MSDKRRVPKPVTGAEFIWLLGITRMTLSRWRADGLPHCYVPWSTHVHFNLQDAFVWLGATGRVNFQDKLTDELE